MKKQISVLFFCLHFFSLHGMENNALRKKKNKILEIVVAQTQAQNPKQLPKSVTEDKKQKPQPVTDANQKKIVNSVIEKKLEKPKKIKLNISNEELNTSGSSASK